MPSESSARDIFFNLISKSMPSGHGHSSKALPSEQLIARYRCQVSPLPFHFRRDLRQVSGLCPTNSELYRSKGAQLSGLELSFSTILFALSVLACLVGMYRLMMSECGNTET